MARFAFAAPPTFTSRKCLQEPFTFANRVSQGPSVFRSVFTRRHRIRYTNDFRHSHDIRRTHHHATFPVFTMALPNVAHKSLTVLVVGSGGREHALVHAISQSPYLKTLLAAPGNVGMTSVCECISVSADDVDALVLLAVTKSVSLVVVGPEVPLVLGLVDRLTERGIAAFGPSMAAAILEGSKVFTKAFLQRHRIPTAWYAAFSDASEAKAFIREKGVPIVVKADGLAAGKGVILAHTVDEALSAVDSILVDRQFGDAGSEIVVEEFVTGEELSFFALLDGDMALPLASAQDHKAAFDGDKGPNTGGMGSYSPAPVCDDALKQQIMTQIVSPTMEGMRAEGREFRGVLYCGVMVDKHGEAKVLEYNVRFGDPECQALCTRMRSDMLELLYRTATGELGSDGFQVEWEPWAAVVVVLATNGYPGSYAKGSVIRHIEAADALQHVKVYHAGTALSTAGEFVANGGRVLGVTASGETIQDACRAAYEAVDVIEWPEGFHRKDIGWRAIARQQRESPAGK